MNAERKRSRLYKSRVNIINKEKIPWINLSLLIKNPLLLNLNLVIIGGVPVEPRKISLFVMVPTKVAASLP